jgi:hypothetical protein
MKCGRSFKTLVNILCIYVSLSAFSGCVSVSGPMGSQNQAASAAAPVIPPDSEKIDFYASVRDRTCQFSLANESGFQMNPVRLEDVLFKADFKKYQPNKKSKPDLIVDVVVTSTKHDNSQQKLSQKKTAALLGGMANVQSGCLLQAMVEANEGMQAASSSVETTVPDFYITFEIRMRFQGKHSGAGEAAKLFTLSNFDLNSLDLGVETAAFLERALKN